MTEVQTRIRHYIIEYKRKNNGISPTLRRIAEALNLSSTSVVHYHINRMCDEGLIYKVFEESGRFGIGVPNSEWRIINE